MKKFIITFLVLFISCDISSQKAIDNPTPVNQIENNRYLGMSRAYFASGCFWCVETIYESLDGVEEVYSGYAGGLTINPNYYQVISGKTGHAEAIEIIYDNDIVSFETLLKVFFDSHDPTTPNRQGPDYGSQYRSIAEPCQNYVSIDQYQEYTKRWMDLYLAYEKINKNDYAELKNRAWEKSTLPNEVKLLMQMLPFSSNYEATQACYEMVQGMTSFMRGVVINLENQYQTKKSSKTKREF